MKAVDVVGDDPKPQYQKFNHITTANANLLLHNQVVDVVGDDPKSFPLTLAHAGKGACKLPASLHGHLSSTACPAYPAAATAAGCQPTAKHTALCNNGSIRVWILLQGDTCGRVWR